MYSVCAVRTSNGARGTADVFVKHINGGRCAESSLVFRCHSRRISTLRGSQWQNDPSRGTKLNIDVCFNAKTVREMLREIIIVRISYSSRRWIRIHGNDDLPPTILFYIFILFFSHTRLQNTPAGTISDQNRFDYFKQFCSSRNRRKPSMHSPRSCHRRNGFYRVSRLFYSVIIVW
jgi:hypothetical protein